MTENRTVADRVIGVVGAGLLGVMVYACVLYGGWFPRVRTIEVVLASSADGSLTVRPDVGRGFYRGDGQESPVVGGSLPQTHVLEIPGIASRIQCMLRSPDPAAWILAISIEDGAGSTPIAGGESARKAGVKQATESLPSPVHVPHWGHLVALGLGLGAALMLLLDAEFGGRLQRLRRRVSAGLTRGSLPALLLVWVGFAGFLLALAASADVYHLLVRNIENPPYWPVSAFDPVQPAVKSWALAAAVLLAVTATLYFQPQQDGWRALSFSLLALAAAITTNLFHGWELGYIDPTGNARFLTDARGISDPLDFLRHFRDTQLKLQPQSRTHPPGAVLVYYALLQATSDAGVMSLVLGSVSLLATGLFLYGILRDHAPGQETAQTLLIFGFLPAVQIYFFSSLDALICACFTGTIYCLLHRRVAVHASGGAALLVCSMALSFQALFLWALLPLHVLWVRRSVRSLVVVGSLTVLAYAILFRVTGFNWVDAFRAATQYENPGGFRLLDNPGSYLFTRLQGVSEMALFAGPSLLLAWQRRLTAHGSELLLLSRLSVLVLGLMLLSGAFKTGETARTYLFIYPLLVLPLCVPILRDRTAARVELHALFSALVAQSVVMQMFGTYSW